MRLYIFKSRNGSLSAFAAESDTRVLPTQHGPWYSVGVVQPDASPPYNLQRAAIEQAIDANGFQLFRLKKKSAA